MRVLIIDGQLNDARDLRTQWKYSHEVRSASSLKNIESLCRSFDPDAAVMYLADMDPKHRRLVEFFQKTNPLFPCLVLVVAPFTHLRLIQRVFDWGVDAFLSAPCDVWRVRKQIEKLMKMRESTKEEIQAGSPR